MAHILVTGGTGFIGRHVGRALLDTGHDVSVLVIGPPDRLRPAPSDPPLRTADLRDPVSIVDALHGVDAVVHQAAPGRIDDDTADLPACVGHDDLGIAILLAGMARAGVQRLTLAGSVGVYGDGAYTCERHGPVRPVSRDPADLGRRRFEPACPRCGADLCPSEVGEETCLDPRTVDAAIGVAQERLASAWADQTGSVATVLRHGIVYGPGMSADPSPHGVVAAFRSALKNGRPPQVYEDGRQLRDFVHVSDVARATVAAVETDRPGFRPYNIGSGRPVGVGAMAAAMADAVAGPRPRITRRFRLRDVRHVVPSPARAAAELGYRARIAVAGGMAAIAPVRTRP